MAKVKLTKNELKKKKDALKMYKRYLPTLQLKKQQLQMEIRGVEARLAQLVAAKEALERQFSSWVAVFSEGDAAPSEIRLASSFAHANKDLCRKYCRCRDTSLRRG